MDTLSPELMKKLRALQATRSTDATKEELVQIALGQASYIKFLHKTKSRPRYHITKAPIPFFLREDHHAGFIAAVTAQSVVNVELSHESTKHHLFIQFPDTMSHQAALANEYKLRGFLHAYKCLVLGGDYGQRDEEYDDD